MLKQQTFFPDSYQLKSLPKITDLIMSGRVVNTPSGLGQARERCHSYFGGTYILSAWEGRPDQKNITPYTQENFIKFHFRLAGGKSTHIFNGFGELDCDRPQLIVLSAPPNMAKLDLADGQIYGAAVNLFVKPEFFAANIGVDSGDLPNALREIVYTKTSTFMLHCIPLTPGLVFSARSFLAASCRAPLHDYYYRAKAVELMCLVMDAMACNQTPRGQPSIRSIRKVSCLYEVRQLLSRDYASYRTLDSLAKEVGMGKTTLTSGFLQLFGMSVFDYIVQERMYHAYQLLKNRELTVTQIAEAVGYNHLSNFSIAFRKYFGCSPRDISRK